MSFPVPYAAFPAGHLHLLLSAASVTSASPLGSALQLSSQSVLPALTFLAGASQEITTALATLTPAGAATHLSVLQI